MSLIVISFILCIELVALTQVSFEEKVAEDSVGGTKSTKRKKKKNKNVDEGATTLAQVRGYSSE